LRRAVLIANPSAGRGRRARTTARILAVFRRAGWEVEPLTTTAPGNATELARRAAVEGADAVFAYGGDGTLREAAAGVLGTHVPVGFLPGGTANVMALALGIPRNPVQAAAVLRNATRREMDVGLCGDEAFLMLASAGFDARVVSGLRPPEKRRFGRGAVALSALRHAFTYPFPAIEVEADGRRLAGSLVAVCNIPFYGGPWRLIPQAHPDDRKLDLLVFSGRGLASTLGLARDLLWRRRHLVRDDVETLRVDEVKLRPGPQPMQAPAQAPVQIDGDSYRPGLPVTIRLSEIRLNVLAP
jgi:YegS/Rv2252/BmrU family lipid kinase